MKSYGNKNMLSLLTAILLIAVLNRTAFAEASFSGPMSVADADSWIAYIGVDNNVWLIHPDGTGGQQITFDAEENPWDSRYPYEYLGLKWSPDGDKIGFKRRQIKTRNIDIYIYDLVSNELRMILTNQQTDGGFDWHLDSDHIIFDAPAKAITEDRYGANCIVGYEEHDGLLMYELSTGEIVSVIKLPGEYPIKNPVVSPNGEYIIFEFQDLDFPRHANQNLIKISDPSSYTKLEGVRSDCSWKPDSMQIACGSWEGYDALENGYGSIKIFDHNGALVTQNYEEYGVYDFTPLWSPIGNDIAFDSSEYPFDLADGPCWGGPTPAEGQKVEFINISDGHRQSLKDGQINDWSPDGRSVLITSDEWEETERRKEGGITRVTGITHYYIDLVDTDTFESRFIANGKEAKWQPLFLQGPASIQDLRVAIISDPEGRQLAPFKLLWTQPDPDSLFLEGTYNIESYEIRYSDGMITAQNWSDAELLAGGIKPTTSGLSEEYLASSSEIFQTRAINGRGFVFLAIRSVDADGIWSPVSNIVQYFDTGFRPNPNGYHFSNSDETEKYKFTSDLLVHMFGEDACEVLYEDICVPTFSASFFQLIANLSYDAGVCFGMSASSSIFYYQDHSPEFPVDAGSVYSLGLETAPVVSNIAYYHASQIAYEPYLYNTTEIQHSNPNSVLQKIASSFVGLSSDTLLLNMKSTDNILHTVTPIAISFGSNGKWKIWVYDSAKWIEYVEINTDEDAWRTEPFRVTWQGDSNSHSLYVTPVSIVAKTPQKLPSAGDYWWLNRYRSESIAIENTHGEQIRYQDGAVTGDMDGVYSIPISNESANSGMYSFILPLGSNYRILTAQYEKEQYSNSFLALAGPNVHIYADMSEDSQRIADEFWIRQDGKHFEVGAFDDREFDLTFSFFPYENRYSFSNIVLPAEGKLSIEQSEENNLVISVLSNDPVRINLGIERWIDSEQHFFSHEGLLLAESSYNKIEIKNWDGRSALSLLVDLDDDEGFEERKLRNEYGSFVTMLQQWLNEPSWLLIIIGTFTLAIGLIGLIGLRVTTNVDAN